jgi:hypothetical protein
MAKTAQLSSQRDDANQIKTALDAARSGGASVPQLAYAHELAEKHGLPATTAEIRTHIRNVIPDPCESPTEIGKVVILGIASGIATHCILRAFNMRKKHHA